MCGRRSQVTPHGRDWQKWGHRQEALREEQGGGEREGGKGGDQGRGRRKKAAGRDRRRSRLERAEILRRRGRGWEERAQGWGSEERRHAGQGL